MRKLALGGPLTWAGLCFVLAWPAWITPLISLDSPQTWPDDIANWVLHPQAGWHQSMASWWATAWLHGSPEHLNRNLAGAALVGALGLVAKVRWPSSLAWFMAWPLTHVGMLWQTTLTSYIGLSGVLHAGAAVVGCHLVIHADRPTTRLVGCAWLLALACKIFMENPWQHVLFLSSASAIKVAPWAHFSGVIAGLVCGTLVHLLARSFAPSFKRH